MAFITYPLNNIDYTAEYAELFHCTRTSGIWAEDSFSISVTGADNNVTIGTGIAWINNEEFSGKVAALKSAEVLDLGIADSTYPRIDVIAIQYSANNNATDVIIKKGTPATNPARPAIIRSGAVYELYLASVYRPAGATAITASNITDLRMDETVCGLMADSVTRVDTVAINRQIMALINELQNELNAVKTLSGVMLKSEWADGNAVAIARGGTGANTPEEALANLGGVSITKLWENENPTTEFIPNYVTLGRDKEYDFFDIVFIENTGTKNTYTTRVSVSDLIRDHNRNNVTTLYTVKEGTTRSRNVSISMLGAPTITVNFYTGYIKTLTISDGQLTTTTTESNTTCVPVAIYGIKGVQ